MVRNHLWRRKRKAKPMPLEGDGGGLDLAKNFQHIGHRVVAAHAGNLVTINLLRGGVGIPGGACKKGHARIVVAYEPVSSGKSSPALILNILVKFLQRMRGKLREHTDIIVVQRVDQDRRN